MKSSTETLIKALDALAQEIESPDGVANSAIAEAAERLRELSGQVYQLQPAEPKQDDWFARGELPPVDIEFELSTNHGRHWHKTKLIFSDNIVFLTSAYQLYKIDDPDVLFRPIKSERDRFIDSCMASISEFKSANQVFGELFDKGFKAPN